MPELCYPCVCCHRPATEEYHWFTDEKDAGGVQEIVWKLCDRCCDFAIEVVESVSQLDNEEERERWQG